MAKAPVKTENTAVTTTGGSQLPAYLQGQDKRSGLQGLDMSDMIVPRIKLMQGISPELDQYEDAKKGEFWLNVLDKALGAEFDFIPVSNRKRYLLSVPLGGSPQGILARADDGVHWKPAQGSWDIKLKGIRDTIKWEIKGDGTVRGSGLAEFGTANPNDPESNPAATLFYDYLVVLPDFPELGPVVLSLSRSAAKRARELNAKIEAGNAPMQALRFTAKVTKENRSDSETYFNYAFQRNGFATEEEFQGARGMAERYKDYRGADEEGAVDEANGGAASEAAKNEKEF